MLQHFQITGFHQSAELAIHYLISNYFVADYTEKIYNSPQWFIKN
ncbi:hypothetical protein CKA32_005914 [Geitlerinema sp. FC II]|nr:hypothetical protein CKA32_005914 [Geitlerinema sp. FC II]